MNCAYGGNRLQMRDLRDVHLVLVLRPYWLPTLEALFCGLLALVWLDNITDSPSASPGLVDSPAGQSYPSLCSVAG